jgi:AraC family transcriptional regulator
MVDAHFKAAREKLIRQREFEGVTVCETEFSWAPDTDMGAYYEDLELHCRLQPYSVHARICWDPGRLRPLGRLALLPAQRTMRARTEGGEVVRTVSCRFDRAWLSEITGVAVDWDAVDFEPLVDMQNANIERSMRRLATEIALPQAGSRKVSEALLAMIAVDLVRHCAGGEDEEGVGRRLSEERLQEIRTLITSAEGRLPTVEQIAAELGMSATYLRREFRNTTGQTLHAFIEESRIAKACALLTAADMPLKLVSFYTGFSQHSTFSYAFKRRTGLTPSEYRARQLS